MRKSEFRPKKLRLEEFNQLWVVEYSVSQNAFAVRTVSEMLENNRLNVLRNVVVDYLPIGFTDNRDEAAQVVEKLRDNIDKQAVRRVRYETDAAESEGDRLHLMEHCDDRLWAKFRMSTES